jgi:hypothetical protein
MRGAGIAGSIKLTRFTTGVLSYGYQSILRTLRDTCHQETIRKAFLPVRTGFRDYRALLREDPYHAVVMRWSRQRVMSSESRTVGAEHAAKCELAADVLRSSGRLRLRVNGWSMLPSVRPGDTLVIEQVSGHEIAEGDIVLFSRDLRLFVHRVVDRRNETSIVTRGDAMRVSDSPINENELLGRVVMLLRNGSLIEPRRRLSLWERLIAGAVRRSELAARLVVGVHGLVQSQQVQPVQVQSA